MQTTTAAAARVLQPVVELRHEGAWYAYSVRAPRSKGVIPPMSYETVGFATLPDCLLDVARALGGNFRRIYVRLGPYCAGERDISELVQAPERVAAELQADYSAADAARLGTVVMREMARADAADAE